MKTRRLGTQGLEVSELGLGCMGMSEFYGSRDEDGAVATIHRALRLGGTFLYAADRERARDPLRRVPPARPLLAERRDVLARRPGRGRLPPEQPALPGRELPAQPRPPRPRPRARLRQGRDARAARARVGAHPRR